ncbi:prolipoprotein diacylglyceryl transferase [bacterium]|nr:prolipoprotein diacylglyceryl transferase [bacterium]
MFEKIVLIYKQSPVGADVISLATYFAVFLILLKVKSISLVKNWFVPVFAIYFGLLFATLFAVFLNGNDSSYYLLDKPAWILILEAFNPLQPNGRVMYGGYFGAIFGVWLANLIFKRKSLPEFLDISAVSISLLFALWRVNCLFSGCCFGYPNKFFGIAFPKETNAFYHLQNTQFVVGNSTVPLLPTQLISAAGDFAVFLFLLILFCKDKTKYPYFYFFAQAFLYGLGRFTIEFFRMDPREFWGPLSMSQWFSLVLIIAGLVFFIKNRKEIAESFKNPISQNEKRGGNE